MTSARDEILGRVRAALHDVEGTTEPVVAPPGAVPPAAIGLVAHFAERVADYRATVVRCSSDAVSVAVAAALPAGARVVVPPGLPDDVLAGVPSPVADAGLTATDLDAMEAVVTCCRVGIAETGTIVLDHEADQGRRAITLVPDRHVCVVYAGQVVPDVPDAFGLLDPQRPQTWISGPSATSDIELDRVEGVHGPRHLHVIIVDERTTAP
ncbi:MULTISPECIES: LUD domain-containing protein [unclassified Nocardioides]|uniref:LutC/YkgG family protein n=1 Tax=unclassified Nocardioides TaxID=2615069 RepID=UPI001154D733|nr:MULTISPECIES: LUD domain-containing protein [unclassified Nocardioides]TQK72876.1 L-lactate dehydrogenase complex protein LldG [Nocardioides sp. SLBN-35]WGY02949.1 LUD domain-containing protein [Nocardioides sp. QY071]